MRVLHVVSSLDPEIGGLAAAAAHSAGYQRAHGVDAVVGSTESRPGAAGYVTEMWPDLPVHVFPERFPRHYNNSPGLRAWLRQETPAADVVAVHGVFKIPFIDAAVLARRHGVPYIVQPHSSLDPLDLRKHHHMKALYGPLVVRRILSGAAAVLVTAEREKERLVTYGTRPSVEVLPLAVRGPDTEPRGERFRRSLGLAPGAELIVFLSRIDPKKGIERLLRATAELQTRRPNLAVAIVGGAEVPSYRAKLETLASELGVSARVRWCGMLLGADKWDALAGADLFVLPSDYENFGIAAVEAILAGTPAVISDGVDVAGELAAAGAVFVCSTDSGSLAATISKALDHPDQARAAARAGQDFIRQEYSPDSVTARTIELYRRVARTRQLRR